MTNAYFMNMVAILQVIADSIYRKTPNERRDMLKEKGACWSCLRRGHRSRECRGQMACNENGCTKKHHKTIHDKQQEISVSTCNNAASNTCLLQYQRVKTKRGWANVMWDNAASLCFVTYSKAKAERLSGTRVQLSIVKVGGKIEVMPSMRYQLQLIDQEGKAVQIEAYGIDKITSDIQNVNIDQVLHLFNDVKRDEILRPAGPVDILIGYEYAGLHPEVEQKNDHLLLLKSRFGRCLGGAHESIRENSNAFCHAGIHTVTAVSIEDFYKIENLGVECTPRCGGCKCGNCPPGSNEYTLKE